MLGIIVKDYIVLFEYNGCLQIILSVIPDVKHAVQLEYKQTVRH